jgi:hypothetical protein
MGKVIPIHQAKRWRPPRSQPVETRVMEVLRTLDELLTDLTRAEKLIDSCSRELQGLVMGRRTRARMARKRGTAPTSTPSLLTPEPPTPPATLPPRA